MKKFIAMLFVVCIVFSLCACGSSGSCCLLGSGSCCGCGNRCCTAVCFFNGYIISGTVYCDIVSFHNKNPFLCRLIYEVNVLFSRSNNSL